MRVSHMSFLDPASSRLTPDPAAEVAGELEASEEGQ